jgi:hypothetical protein
MNSYLLCLGLVGSGSTAGCRKQPNSRRPV